MITTKPDTLTTLDLSHEELRKYRLREAIRRGSLSGQRMFLKTRIGSIEIGKYADPAVWDRKPYQVPTSDLRDMRYELMLFSGKIVFQGDTTL